MTRQNFIAALQAMRARQPVYLPDLRPKKVRELLTSRRRRNELLATIVSTETLQPALTSAPPGGKLLDRLHASTFAVMAALSKQLTGVPRSPEQMQRDFADQVGQLGDAWQVLQHQEAISLQDMKLFDIGRKVRSLSRKDYLQHLTTPLFAPIFDKALIFMSHVFGVNFLLFIDRDGSESTFHCVNRGSPHDIYAILRLITATNLLQLYQRQPPGDEGVPPRIFTWDTLPRFQRNEYRTRCLSHVGTDRAPLEPLDEV